MILVHGSGPHDRDETIGPNKPFRDLAHGLASQGIAVLRYEKRTKEHPIRMALSVNTITVKEETIDDAVAAFEALASQEKIDPKRIFVLGHSLGGTLLPRIGKAKDGIAGFISLQVRHGPWKTWCWTKPGTSCRWTGSCPRKLRRSSRKLSSRWQT